MEAEKRIEDKFPKLDFEYVSTMHAMGRQALEIETKTRLLKGSKWKPFKNFSQVCRDMSFETKISPNGIPQYQNNHMKIIDYSRSKKITLIDAAVELDLHEYVDVDLTFQINQDLESYKDHTGMVEYCDMITKFVEKDKCPNLEVVFLDEAQDLSWLQWKMVERIIENSKRVYVAGDDDQAIYRWAGARPEYLINMEGQRTVLNKSYRLSKLIHRHANKLITRISDRVDKEWTSRDDDGEVNIYPIEQLQKMKEGQWLILARDRYRLDKLEEDLKIYGYYYKRADKTSINKRIHEAILAWEEKLYNFEALKNNYGLKVDKDLPWFKALKNIPPSKSIYVRAVLRRGENIRHEPRIKLSTIHGSKGGESDNVMLLTDLSRKADDEYWKNRDSERRVFYVGMTRARNILNIVRSQSDREFSEVF